MNDDWRTPDFEALCRGLRSLESDEEMAAFLRDVCTVAELQALGHRLAAARLVDQGVPYAEIARRVGCSTTTVTRVAHWLRHGEGGYGLVLERTAGGGVTTLRVALPSKGRLAEPSLPPLPRRRHGRRARRAAPAPAAARARPRRAARPRGRHPRAARRPRGRRRHRGREPGRGGGRGARRRCWSSATAAAGSRSRRRPTGPCARRATCEGLRVATSYPATTRAFLAARGVAAQLIAISGSVELAPSLGAAEAVADLVSSGETLRQNGLAELETIIDSQAVLLARPDPAPDVAERVEHLRVGLASVLAARPKRYLMLNAHDETLDAHPRAAAGDRRPDRAAPGARRHARRARRRRPGRRRPAARPAQGARRERHPRPPHRAPDPMTSAHAALRPARSSPARPRTAGRRACRTGPSAAST